MAAETSLTAALETIAGPRSVTSDVRHFVVDGVVPSAAVHPESEEQVAAIVRHANDSGLAIIPWGGGGSMRTGNLPARYDIALVLDRLAGITEHEPADLTVTCRAGTTLSELADSLREHNQMAPFERYAAAGSTVGGALAANAFGASRQTFGAPRDFTIGMRVVTGDGLIVKAGGKVVKNVAGYDMCKLFIGSRGTLGIIVEATLKLTPLEPVCERVTWVRSFEEACLAASRLNHDGRIRAAIAANQHAASSVYGDAPGAALYTDSGNLTSAEMPQWMEEAKIAGPAVEPHLLRAALASTPESLQARASVLPTDVPALVADAERIAAGVQVFAQPVTGDVVLRFPDVDGGVNSLPALRKAAAGVGGTLILEDCPPEVKQVADVFGGPPPAFSLMRAVKQQFDPKNVLSPGRFVGGL